MDVPYRFAVALGRYLINRVWREEFPDEGLLEFFEEQGYIVSPSLDARLVVSLLLFVDIILKLGRIS